MCSRSPRPQICDHTRPCGPMAHGVERRPIVLDRRAPVPAASLRAASVVLDTEEPEHAQPSRDAVRLRALQLEPGRELDGPDGDPAVPRRVVQVSSYPVLGRAEDDRAPPAVPRAHERIDAATSVEIARSRRTSSPGVISGARGAGGSDRRGGTSRSARSHRGRADSSDRAA